MRMIPADQTSQEPPQGDQLPAFGDEDNIADPELGAGYERALLALRAIDVDAVLAVEVTNAPTAHGPHDAGVRT
jgi:hypothetical protein